MLFLHQEVDKGGAGRQKGLFNSSSLEVLDSKFTLQNQLVDFFTTAGCLLGHPNLPEGFVIDLKERDRKARTNRGD